MYTRRKHGDSDYHQANTRATTGDEGNLALDIEDIAELEVGVRHFDYNQEVLLLCRREARWKRVFISLLMEVASDVLVTIAAGNWWGHDDQRSGPSQIGLALVPQV